jgi:hypothetical protein
MNLLLVSKKQSVVSSYRAIRQKKQQSSPAMAEFRMMRTTYDDSYETVRMPERRQVTWGADVAKLADWPAEEQTAPRRLPLQT